MGNAARLPCRREDVHGLQARPPKEQCVDIALISAAIVVGLFAAYNLFHYMLFLLVTHPRDAGNIGHALNEFEQRQLVEWTPKAADFLKHDDENRTYDDLSLIHI